MKRKIIKIREFLLDLLFPPVCLVCRKKLASSCQTANQSFSLLCHSCSQKIQINNGFFCPICSGRLPENKKICHSQAPFVLAAAGSYKNETLRQLIHLLKYQKIKQAAIPLGEILNEYLIKNCLANKDEKNGDWLLVPVPLHWLRQKRRGFNQSELLAQKLAEITGFKIINALKRMKRTAAQAELKEIEQRKMNVNGCFAAVQQKFSKFLFRRNIILLDDVYTSGSTMTEAAKILKQAGAKKIVGLTVVKA